MTQDYIEKDNWKTIIGYADELADFHKNCLDSLYVDAGPEGERSEEDIEEIKVYERLLADLKSFKTSLVECERQVDGYYKVYSLIREWILPDPSPEEENAKIEKREVARKKRYEKQAEKMWGKEWVEQRRIRK